MITCRGAFFSLREELCRPHCRVAKQQILRLELALRIELLSCLDGEIYAI